jgi:hypothetical protein
VVLGERAADGRYAPVDGPAALADLVTEDLQSLNGDRHLRLKHHTAEIPDLPDGAAVAEITRLAQLTMGGAARVERLAGNVGHLDLNPLLFPPSLAGDAVVAAMQLTSRTEALIIDVRGNKGGDPEMVACCAAICSTSRCTSPASTSASETVPGSPGPCRTCPAPGSAAPNRCTC